MHQRSIYNEYQDGGVQSVIVCGAIPSITFLAYYLRHTLNPSRLAKTPQRLTSFFNSKGLQWMDYNVKQYSHKIFLAPQFNIKIRCGARYLCVALIKLPAPHLAFTPCARPCSRENDLANDLDDGQRGKWERKWLIIVVHAIGYNKGSIHCLAIVLYVVHTYTYSWQYV